MEILRYNDIDLAITTRELAKYLKKEKINLAKLKNSSYNSLLGKGSSGGIIFGTSGGVMEATLREVYHILYKRYPKGHETPEEAINDIEGWNNGYYEEFRLQSRYKEY